MKHLPVLVRDGLASTRRDGREVRYFAHCDGAAGASRWLNDKSLEYDRRLACLEKKLGSLPRRA